MLNQTTLHLPSPAKLNLFLHITGRREDGYHNLQTLFHFTDLCDQLSFTLTDKDSILLLTDIVGVAKEDNLIYKAAHKLLPYRPAHNTNGIEITLKKQLPMGGGIGGGSSNAATTLLALNQLWQCNLSLDKLASIGLELGADVPIFIFGKSAFAEGVGEQLTAVELDEVYYLLIHPNCSVETARIFADKNLTRDTPTIKIAHALKLDGRNDCLEPVRQHNPEINDAFLWLNNHANAKLTGTGSCIFASFDNRDDAMTLKESVPSLWTAWVCQGCNLSPTHLALNQWVKTIGV